MSFFALIDPDSSKFGSTRLGDKGTETNAVSMVTRRNRTDTEKDFDMAGMLHGFPTLRLRDEAPSPH
jgi:hypothetical protein